MPSVQPSMRKKKLVLVYKCGQEKLNNWIYVNTLDKKS